MARSRKAGFFVEAEFLDHWRRDVAGAAGVGVWALAGAWCDEHLTDGHIPLVAVKRLVAGAGAAAARVTKAGLWTDCCEHDECLLLHRYTEDGRGRKRQSSRADVLARQEAERQRKRSIPAGKVPVIRKESARNPRGTSGVDSSSLSEVPPLSPPQGTPQPEAAPPKAPPKTRPRLLPDSWQPNEAAIAYAALHRLDLDGETEKFRGFHGLKGTLGRDWDAGFRAWLRKAVEFRDERAARNPVAAAAPAVRPSRKIV